MANTALKDMHDALLADQPEGAEHDSETCTLCAMEATTDPAPAGEPGGTMKTYTEEEVKAAVQVAVDEAVAGLRAQVEELNAERAASESEQALAELRDSFEAEKAELQAKLDEAVLQATTEKEAHDQLVAWLEGEAKAAEESAAIEARREERLATAKAAADFPEDFVKYLEDSADRLAAMDDEEFTARVTEWAALAGGKPAKPSSKDDKLPAETALHASREGRDAGGKPKSAVKELFEMRRSGIDPRTL
jgi:hypothetical protein